MTQIRIIDTELQRRLTAIVTRSRDLTPAMRSVGEYMLGRTRERFDTQTAPDGSSWQPLAESTIKAKRRRQQTGRPYRTRARPESILKDTFTLRDTIAYLATRDSVAIGTNLNYGIFHQSEEPRTKIPRRPFLGVNGADRTEIVAIVADYLNG